MKFWTWLLIRSLITRKPFWCCCYRLQYYLSNEGLWISLFFGMFCACLCMSKKKKKKTRSKLLFENSIQIVFRFFLSALSTEQTSPKHPIGVRERLLLLLLYQRPTFSNEWTTYWFIATLNIKGLWMGGGRLSCPSSFQFFQKQYMRIH